jgi:patatin-like phospholipase/acyl hydrolase
MTKTVRILSIDGGGMRGLIPALVLEHLEALTGRPVSSLFDLVAGSSTGGIMTLLLTRPGASGRPLYTAKDVVGLYTDHGRELFYADPAYQQESQGGWAMPKYPSSSAVTTLSTYLADAELKDALTDVFVTAYDLDRRRPFFFERARARRPSGSGNFRMLDAARATCAFPAMFPAVEARNVAGNRTYHLIDGGMVSANPAALAYGRAKSLFGADARLLMVSLGTGDYEAPLPFAQVGNWGLGSWAPRLPDALFDGVNHGVDYAMEETLRSSEYFRFQVTLPAANEGTDDVSPANLDGLRRIVEDAIRGAGRGVLPDSDRPRRPWPGRFAELRTVLEDRG